MIPAPRAHGKTRLSVAGWSLAVFRRGCAALALVSIAVLLGPGCTRSTANYASAGEYAYATTTPEEEAAARARYDQVVKLFGDVGIHTSSGRYGGKGSKTEFSGKGIQGEVSYELKDTGFSRILLNYQYQADAAEAGRRAEGDRLISQAQRLLAPNPPAISEKRR
jgi:hypothetical protein